MSAERIITQNIKTPEECSLYRAICWIAFKDKIIDEAAAQNLYRPRFEITQKFKEDAQSKWFESNIEWISSDDKESYEEATRLLKTRLYIGDIKAKGFALVGELTASKDIIQSKISGWYEGYETFYNYIDSKFWEPSARIDWIESEAENLSHPLKNNEKYRAYTSIKIKTDDLKKLFPLRDGSKASVGGRPPKYDWESFNAEIIRKAHHPDGLPEQKADLEKQMAQWCCDTWGDQPADSLIRAKISKIYQALNKAKK